MASAFRPALELLAMYAAYHRDRRNIATHFVGIPMIVFAVCILLARPGIEIGGWQLAPIHALLLLSTVWYLTRGAFLVGLVTALINAGFTWAALPLAAGSTASWLGWGLGLFALGWIIQFVGHKYEGRKPAFVDDLVGLLVGPMFLVAEAMFAMGLEKPLRQAIEARVGPTRAAPAAAHA